MVLVLKYDALFFGPSRTLWLGMLCVGTTSLASTQVTFCSIPPSLSNSSCCPDRLPFLGRLERLHEAGCLGPDEQSVLVIQACEVEVATVIEILV
jgi:hypothetical protein